MDTERGVLNLQLGVALAVILIVYYKLSHISSFHVDVGTRSYNATGSCLLDSNTSAPGALPLQPLHAACRHPFAFGIACLSMQDAEAPCGNSQACACMHTLWRASAS